MLVFGIVGLGVVLSAMVTWSGAALVTVLVTVGLSSYTGAAYIKCKMYRNEFANRSK